MASRTGFAAYSFKVAPRSRPAETVRLDDLDGSGLSLLHLIHGFLQDLSATPYADHRYQQYFATESIEPRGNTLRFGANFGRFGFQGEIVDTTTHETTHEFGEDESAVTGTRNLVVILPGGTHGLFFAERYGGRGGATLFARELRKAFGARMDIDRLLLHAESLIDEAGWTEYINGAKLTGIKIVRYGLDSDIAGGLSAETVGRLVYEVKRRRGVGSFGQAIKQRLLDGELKAQQIMGLEMLDTDETQLTLDDGTQQKQLVIGRDEPAALVYMIEQSGDDRPSDEAVYLAMEQKAEELGRRLGLEFPTGWQRGGWASEQLGIKMEAVRDR